MPVIDLPEPVFAVAIAPNERLDEAKLSQMLARLIDEDPALRLMRAEFTNELELCGSGEVHLAVAAERLQRKYNVAVETKAPQIAYRETITHRHRSARALQTSNRRPRAVRRGAPAHRTARTRPRRHLRREGRRRRDSAAVLPGRREGRSRSADARPERLPGRRSARHALRRVVPRGRLERGLVQDRRLDGDPRRAAEVRRHRARTDLRDRSAGAGAVRIGDGLATHRRSAASCNRSARPKTRRCTASRRSSRKPNSRTTSPSCAPRPKASARSAAATNASTPPQSSPERNH